MAKDTAKNLLDLTAATAASMAREIEDLISFYETSTGKQLPHVRELEELLDLWNTVEGMVAAYEEGNNT